MTYGPPPGQQPTGWNQPPNTRPHGTPPVPPGYGQPQQFSPGYGQPQGPYQQAFGHMPPTPRRGSITLMIFAAIAAAGAGVFWIIRGIVGLSGLSSTWGYYDEPAAQRYAAAQDMNLGIAKGFDCASDIAEIIVGILLFTGITFLLLRKRSGSTWISVGGLLGLLPLILFVFRDIYWSAPLFPPAGAIAAFIIGVVALVFALLPAVRSTARPPTPYDPPSARPW